MKTSDSDRIYEVLGFRDAAWVWYGSDDVTLPQEVYDRLAQGITGKFAVREKVYWIRITHKQLDSR